MGGFFWIGLFTFVAVACGLLALLNFVDSRRNARSWRNRVEGIEAVTEDEEETSGFQYLSDRVLGLLQRVGQIGEPKKAQEVSALQTNLVIAGYRRASAPNIFLGVKLVAAIGLPLLLWLSPTPWMHTWAPMKRSLLYLFTAIIGTYGPELWLSRAMKKRQEKITDAFPDALDLLVVCVEAGLGLDSAIDRAGVELELAHPELSDEFRLLGLELRAGLPRSQALIHLGDRVGINEIRSFVALLIQTDRFGTSIGQALRVHSDAMRTERSLRAEEAANKLPVKLLFPLIMFIFPSLFIVILGPAVVQGVRILIPALGG